MINDELNSRSVNFLGLVTSLYLFTTLILELLSILLIIIKTPLLIILIWLNLCSFWIRERRFGSFSILQISLWTGNFYYLTGLDNLLSNLALLLGIQYIYLIISRPHLTITIVLVLFLMLFQVEFDWNWVKGIMSRISVR